MEDNKNNAESVPELGNPLSGGLPAPEYVAASPVSAPVQAPAEVSQTASDISAASPAPYDGSTATSPIMPIFDPTVPPSLISTAASVGGVTLPEQSSETKPHLLGIIIGIFFLISVVVAASLYYYFYIYKVAQAGAVSTPPPVTLIKETSPEVAPVATSTEVAGGSIPPQVLTPPSITPEELLTEIDNASSSLSSSDGSVSDFDDQVK